MAPIEDHLHVGIVGELRLQNPIGGIEPVLVVATAEKIAAEALRALTHDPAPPAVAAAAVAAVAVDGPDDLDAFQNWAMDEHWSEGLPVLPPTAERVERMLGRHREQRAEVVATLAPRWGHPPDFIASLDSVP